MDQIIGEQGAGQAPAGLIKDGSIQTFGEDVIAASRERPVIVDFWADWCGPCKQLMPALEAAVTKAAGAVALVKVNADENQQLCAQLQVQSLPTVLAFWQGQPIDGFQGAVPPSEIDAFIGRITQASGGAGGHDPLAAALDQADELLAAGQAESAAQILQQVLAHDNSNIRGLIAYAEASIALGELDQAKQITAAIDTKSAQEAKLTDRLSKVETAIELAEQAASAGDVAELEAAVEKDPTDHQARFDLALALQAKGDMPGAAESLLGSIMRDREWNEGAARAQLLKLFEAAGPTDPFTLKYRRRLSSILFS